ncbi:MAG: glycerol-3-phosphate dehydrogenase [Oscillospiraceae bacterium]|nr:glycerol-3-phosphate dehydrogenase [Oscillospiraceae bacterium]
MAEISVLGSGRWGSLIAWYLEKIGHSLILWGKKNSPDIDFLIKNRNNGSVFFGEKILITSDLKIALKNIFLVVSINSQNLRDFLNDLVCFSKENNIDLKNKIIILCMKGIEEPTGKRLTEVVGDLIPKNKNVAIWVGPGHVKSLLKGTPTCMVVDSNCEDLKFKLTEMFSSPLIRCYRGSDLVGNEIGAAAKNVLGIAAGILDALGMAQLKGALMARGAKEVSILMEKMGGKKESAFGLCHLGDYQATLFSKESNNRKFGETLVTGENVDFIAEGVGTSSAIEKICLKNSIDLPIFHEIYKLIFKKTNPKSSLLKLFSRKLTEE